MFFGEVIGVFLSLKCCAKCCETPDKCIWGRFIIQMVGFALFFVAFIIFQSVEYEIKDVPAYAICIKLSPAQCEKSSYMCKNCDNQTDYKNPFNCTLKDMPDASVEKDGKKFVRKLRKCYNSDCKFKPNAKRMAAEYALLWISVVNLLCHVVNRRIELGHEDGHEDINIQDGNTQNNQSSCDYEYPVIITQNSNTTQMRMPVDEPILLRAMSPLKISSGASGIQIELDPLLVKRTDNVSPRPPTAGADIGERETV